MGNRGKSLVPGGNSLRVRIKKCHHSEDAGILLQGKSSLFIILLSAHAPPQDGSTAKELQTVWDSLC